MFGSGRVEYLGHVITEEGVERDPSKVEAVQKRPIPQNIKNLCGFLGLTGYYRRFIRNYGLVCQPLTALLKNNSFQWTTQATVAFGQLKHALSLAPVLALPNFSLPFEIETDASGVGIGAVLLQQGHPIAYISKALSQTRRSGSAYERELYAILFAVKKWEHYLKPKAFVIRTDHRSLKYLLDQKLKDSTTACLVNEADWLQLRD